MPKALVSLLIVATILVGASSTLGQEWQGPAAIALQVTTEKGEPVTEAQVLARLSEGDPNAGPPLGTTDGAGRVVISGLVEGEWYVEVSHPGYMLFASYINLRAGKKPQIGFSSQVNTDKSFTPMRVKFSKASASFNRGSTTRERTEPKAPEVIRQTPPPPQATPPTVVRPERQTEAPAPEVTSIPDTTRTEVAEIEPPEIQPTKIESTEIEAPLAAGTDPEAQHQAEAETAAATVPMPTPPPSAEPPSVEPPSAEPPVTEPLAAEPPAASEPIVTTQPPLQEAPVSGEEPASVTTPGDPVPTSTPSEPAEPVEDPAAASAPVVAEPPAVTESPAITDSPAVTESPGEELSVEPPTAELKATSSTSRAEAPASTTEATDVAASISTPGSPPPSQPVQSQPIQPPAIEPPPVTPTPESPVPEAPSVEDKMPTVPEVVLPTPETAETDVAAPAPATEPAEEAISATSGERTVTPPQPDSADTADTTPSMGRIPRYLRSAAAGSCSECEAGEWAVAAEQVAARTGDSPSHRSCPDGFVDDARQAAQLLADLPAPRLDSYAGPVLTAMFRMPPGEARSSVQDLLAPLTDPEAYCQMAGVVLPDSSSYNGHVLEAWDSLGGRSCSGNIGCAVGSARWLEQPIVVQGAERVVIYDVFKNGSTRRERRARMTIYFQPPTTGWRPASR